MNPALINAILINIVIPQIARRLATRGGAPLSKDELLALMDEEAAAALAAGAAFLAKHGA